MSASLPRRLLLRRIGALGAVLLLQSCAERSAALPKPRVTRLGFVGGGVATLVSANSETFRQALSDLGYAESDIAMELRAADADLARVPALVAELINLPVDVLVTTGSPAALAAKSATTTMPVVFIRATDPVRQGIVASLARPGGNVTGVSAASLTPKQLELLQTTVPNLRRVAVLWNANNPGAALQLKDTEEAAGALRLVLEAYPIRNPDELEVAMGAIERTKPDALMVGPAFNIAFDLGKIPNFAAAIRLPQIYSTDLPWVAAGGLMAVGSNFAAEAGRAARLVDKILRGTNPADLPVELPSQIDLIVNLSASARIGLTIPESVLRQASEVIR